MLSITASTADMIIKISYFIVNMTLYDFISYIGYSLLIAMYMIMICMYYSSALEIPVEYDIKNND